MKNVLRSIGVAGALLSIPLAAHDAPLRASFVGFGVIKKAALASATGAA